MRKKPTKKNPITSAADNGPFLAEGAFAAFDLLPVHVLGIDAGGKIVYANPAAQDLFDHPGQGLLGAPLAEVGSPIIAGGWAGFWSGLKKRGLAQGEAVLLQDPGRPTPVRWRALVLRGRRRAHACLFVRPGDQPAPAALDFDRDRKQLTRLLENLAQAATVWDEDLRIVYANPEACARLGMPVARAIGKTVFDLLPKPQADLIWAKQRQALDACDPVRFSAGAGLGEARGMSVTIIPVIDATDSRRHLVMLANRADRRDAVKKTPAGPADLSAPPIPVSRVRASLNSAPVLAVIKDRHKRFMWVNPAFAAEFGIDPGKPLEEEMHARFGTVGLWAEEDEQVMATKRPVFNIVEQIGGRGFYRKDKIPLLDENDEVVGLLGVLVPLKDGMTDQTTGEKRYQRVLRKLDSLSAIVQARNALPPRDNQEPPDQMERLQQMVLPYVNHLRRGRLNKEQRRLLAIIEKSIASHTPEPLSRDYNLSPNEMRVAQWVREGKTNEEIAALMGLSKSTILTHRHHVRVKFGLKNKKVNLRTFLSELNVA